MHVPQFFSDIYNKLSCHPSSQLFTVVIEEYPEPDHQLNRMFQAAKAYLRATETTRLCEEFRTEEQENVEINGLEILDYYKDVQLRWKPVCIKYRQLADGDSNEFEKNSYELTFPKKHIGSLLNSYLAYILEQEKAIKKEAGAQNFCSSDIGFDNLVMDSENKKAVLDDLNNFMSAKEFYWRIGKAWNRRYLLYGPPGTGKSRLISAIANHLNYNIYELDGTRFQYPAAYVQGLPHQSVLVIKNVECNTNEDAKKHMVMELIRTTGGLWSCCGSECIIIFLMNQIECVNPAMLMPSHMDMIIDMSRCNTPTIRSTGSLEENSLHVQ